MNWELVVIRLEQAAGEHQNIANAMAASGDRKGSERHDIIAALARTLAMALRHGLGK